MPVKVYFDDNGKIYYTEPLHEAMFFVPEGVELDHIDLSNPDAPVAITKGIAEGLTEDFAEVPEDAEVIEEAEVQPAEETEEG